jgi:hypothetical protein
MLPRKNSPQLSIRPTNRFSSSYGGAAPRRGAAAGGRGRRGAPRVQGRAVRLGLSGSSYVATQIVHLSNAHSRPVHVPVPTQGLRRCGGAQARRAGARARGAVRVRGPRHRAELPDRDVHALRGPAARAQGVRRNAGQGRGLVEHAHLGAREAFFYSIPQIERYFLIYFPSLVNNDTSVNFFY